MKLEGGAFSVGYLLEGKNDISPRNDSSSYCCFARTYEIGSAIRSLLGGVCSINPFESSIRTLSLRSLALWLKQSSNIVERKRDGSVAEASRSLQRNRREDHGTSYCLRLQRKRRSQRHRIRRRRWQPSLQVPYLVLVINFSPILSFPNLLHLVIYYCV